MVLPVPTLDHVVVNARDDLDGAAAVYRRLGFTLTPRGYHTLGSMNHLAIFGTEYLELIAARPGDRRRAEVLDSPIGLNGVVFGTEDSAGVFHALDEAGVPVEQPLEFSRPVELADGAQDAVFRTVRLKPGAVSAGRLYFCHHFTRSLVWRDEWRHHPNGVIGVDRIVIVSDPVSAVLDVLERMFGEDAIRRGKLLMGLTTLSVVKSEVFTHLWNGFEPEADDRSQYMAGLGLRVHTLDRTAEVLREGGVPFSRTEVWVRVAARDAFGVALEFRE